MATTRMACVLLVALVAGGVAGCSDEEPVEAWATDNSSIVDGASAPKTPARGAATDDDADAGAGEDAAEPTPEEPAEERELVAARTSQSTFGRTRDRARDLNNQISGGATTDAAIAEVGNEHWIEAAGLRWVAPEDWQIAIPADPAVAAEAVVPHAMGNASVTVREVALTPERALQAVSATVLDDVGSAMKVRPTEHRVAGLRVLRLAADGTVVDPRARGGEQPFWSVRSAAVEREGRPTVVITLVGPEDTVRANEALWEAMIEGMEER